MPKRTTSTSQQPLEHSRYEAAEASPGYLFWRAFHAWQRHMRTRLDTLGITQVQYSILATTSYLVSQGAAVSQQDVASQLAMDKMMVSDVVKALEARSLITRQRSEADARSFVLAVTRAGRELLKRATPAVEAVDESFFGVLPASERSRLIKSMRQLGAE